MKRAARHPHVAVFLLAVLLLAGLSSCDIVFADMYPPELQDAAATLDLPAAINSAYGARFKSVVAIRQLTASSKTALFVLCDTDLGLRVAVLGPGDLSVLAMPAISGTLNPLGADGYGSGRFWVGLNSLDASFVVTNPVNFVTNYSFVIPGGANLTWMYKSQPGMFASASVDAAWGSQSGEQWAIISSSSSAWEFRDIVSIAGGPACAILLYNRDERRAVVQVYADPGILNSSMSAYPANLLGDASSYLSSTTVFDVDGDCWLMDGYLVATNHDRESRLVKYAYGSGAQLDSRLFDGSWKDHAYFAPSGDYWYFYDLRRGRLCSFRTWW